MAIFERTIHLMKLGHTAWRLRGAASETVAANARLTLVERMGQLRGLPQKVGQILSMSDRDTATTFQPLCDHATPLPFEVLRPEIENAWQTPIEQRLRSVDPSGRAASLGQVHRAQLLDGHDVAIKVRYPDVANAVARDLSFLGWLSLPFGGLRRKGFSLGDYQAEILRDLEEELDYRIEANNQRQFQPLAHHVPGLVVPQVIDSLSGENVLVTNWEEGQTIDEVRALWSAKSRRELAKRLLLLFGRSLLDEGLLHADPHPGNYRFRSDSDPRIILYDYGSVCRIERDRRRALVRLILGALDRRAEDPYPLFLTLGFRADMLEPLRDRLPALCQILFEPFICKCPYDLKSWKRSERVGDILGEDRWNFRISGPASLIL